MTKTAFLDALNARLQNLPQAEREKSLQFYEEMIGDRMEDGMSEEEATAALGPIEDIVASVMQDMSFSVLLSTGVKSSRRRAQNKSLWTVLAIVGSPFWVPLLLAGIVLLFALYLVLFAVILSLFAVLLATAVACVGGILGGVMTALTQSVPVALCIFGMSLVCGGLFLLLFQPICTAAKACIALFRWMLKKIKGLFVRRPVYEEDAR